jgi:hypothetical protein
MKRDLTNYEWQLVLGALSSMLRYQQRNLDRAKDADAVDRWAQGCVRTKALMEKIEGGGS